MKTYLATDDVVNAVDAVIEALHVEPDERVAFGEASQDFLNVMQQWSIENDRQDWPPLSTLVALETELLDFGNASDLDIDRAAAVSTVRDYLVQAKADQAKLN